MTRLQHLAIGQLYLSPHTIPALKDLLDSLPASVTKLTLHTFNVPGDNETDIQFEEIQSLQFFTAVAWVRDLHMPNWKVRAV